ncbi:MAG: hypothetical protein IPF99_29035 [Deltaproteobacteria bacterium]|nr:hypothetical protein [Deltaproteobacteria bacterium]
MQNSIASQIGQILEARRARVPRVEHQLEQLRAVDRHITQLEVALDEFVAVEGVPGDVKSEVSTFRNASHRAAVARSVEVLQAVKGRMSRDAVNIGVSGQARVGKSSLLQGISGLGESQVPTGSGVPVTAVRSRIVHSAHERAVVKLRCITDLRAAGDRTAAPCARTGSRAGHARGLSSAEIPDGG